MLVKICPSCGYRNKSNEILCVNCMSDISSVSAIDESKISEDTKSFSSQEVEQKEEIVVLKLKEKNSGQIIDVKSGDVVGRYSVDFFQKMNNYKLISRLHFQVLYKEGKWFIRDLESTNGTFLNTKKLEPDKDYEIKKGDVINIAGIVDFIVQ